MMTPDTAHPPCGYCLKASMTAARAALWIPAQAGIHRAGPARHDDPVIADLIRNLEEQGRADNKPNNANPSIPLSLDGDLCKTCRHSRLRGNL